MQAEQKEKLQQAEQMNKELSDNQDDGMNEESSSGSSHSDSDTGSDDGDDETHESEKKLSTILKKKNDGKDSNVDRANVTLTCAAVNSSDEEYSIPDKM